MDIHTYFFTKETLFHETSKTNIPEELKDIVEWLKRKGFILESIENPQTKPFSKEIIEGSYSVDLAYDLGEKQKQFLLVNILKNQWVNWKTEWWLTLGEVENEWIGKGNDFEELKQKVTSYFNNELC